MNQEQISFITNYFKSNEKKKENFKIGAEFEYFVVDKDSLEVISYEGHNGVLSTLETLLYQGYEGIYDGNHLMGLRKGQSTITLEPGCQLEISVRPQMGIVCIETEYKKICQDIMDVLERKNQVLLASGYQVQNKIDEVVMIPKKRYHFMYEYFKSCGIYAHHMMKQTASTQVTIDYENELDYQKKYRILNTLSPVFYAFFDNGPIFENEIYPKHCIRSKIWDCCDESRCGIIMQAIEENFNYESYAKYLLNQSIIFKDDAYTGHTLFKDLFVLNNQNQNELEHGLSMIFPDIRTRKFIEIRMIDSLPYPLNFSVIAFIKGLFYHDENLNELYQFVKDITPDEIRSAKQKMIDYGIDVSIKSYSIYEIMKYLFTLAYKGLDDAEKKYLMPIMHLIQAKKTPQQITKEMLNLGKANALAWCMMKKRLFWEDYKWMQAV